MDNFFEIINRNIDGENIIYTVRINPNHRVFEGHFPGNPIVPGVMSLMMIRQCAEEKLGYQTRFSQISQCKYTGLIVPNGENLLVNFRLDDKTINAEIIGSSGDFLIKLKALLA